MPKQLEIPEGYTPGPWRLGHRGMSVDAENAKIGGAAKLFDVRGWGYLTGRGHGGLALSDDEARAIQIANGTLAALAPEMADALRAQAAEIATLRARVAISEDALDKAGAKLREAQAEIVALTAALTTTVPQGVALEQQPSAPCTHPGREGGVLPDGDEGEPT